MDSIAISDEMRVFLIPLIFLLTFTILVVVSRTRNHAGSSPGARIFEIFLVAITCLVLGAFVTQSLQTDPPLLPALDRAIEFTIDSYGFKYVGRSDNVIDVHMLRYGAYEKPVLFFMRDVMQSRDSPGIFVDVGANTGQHSLFMSSP